MKTKKCPKCGEEMENKGYINEPPVLDSDYAVGVSIYQCSKCKNIEMIKD